MKFNRRPVCAHEILPSAIIESGIRVTAVENPDDNLESLLGYLVGWMIGRTGRDLSETVWTRLDRKAGAVIELTIRQLRHKISTWVVLALGMI